MGSQDFNDKYFEYMFDVLDGVSGPRRIYLMGDLFESADKRVGNSAFRTDMTLDEQIDVMISYLKPYKRDIVVCIVGNHEVRLVKEFDFNPMWVLSHALGVDYAYQHLDTFRVNGTDYRVHVSHGKGSSAHYHTAMSKIIRDTQHVDADVIMQGHNHRCMHFSIPKVTGAGFSRRHYVMTGSFLRYGGYADMQQLPPLPEAFVTLHLNRERVLRSNVYYIDEVRPDLLDISMFRGCTDACDAVYVDSEEGDVF